MKRFALLVRQQVGRAGGAVIEEAAEHEAHFGASRRLGEAGVVGDVLLGHADPGKPGDSGEVPRRDRLALIDARHRRRADQCSSPSRSKPSLDTVSSAWRMTIGRTDSRRGTPFHSDIWSWSSKAWTGTRTCRRPRPSRRS